MAYDEVETFIEEIGEKTLDVLNSLLKRIKEFLEKIKKSRNALLETRGIELKDYTILMLQVFSMLFLFLSAIFIFDFPASISLRSYFISGIFLLILSVYILFTEVKKYFEEDFPAYRDFFLPYLSLGIILALVKIVKPYTSFIFPYMHYILISVLGALLISFLFRNKYAREHTFGKVLEADFEFATVKINYDIRANVKPMKYTFKNRFNAKKGDIVKISVKKRFFGSIPEDIIGVQWS